MAITPDVSKIRENVRAFIFNVLSETVIGFVWICLALDIKSAISFIRIHFYRKRGCVIGNTRKKNKCNIHKVFIPLSMGI